MTTMTVAGMANPEYLYPNHPLLGSVREQMGLVKVLRSDLKQAHARIEKQELAIALQSDDIKRLSRENREMKKRLGVWAVQEEEQP